MNFLLTYWYSIPGSIIAGCIVVVGYIIIRKFPQLSLLDVEHIPDEWQAKRKKELLAARVAEESKKKFEEMAARLSPIRRFWAKLQLQFRIYFGRVQRLWIQEKAGSADGDRPLNREERRVKLQELIQEAYEHSRTEKFDLAEGLFIAAIKMNPSAAEAYRGLAETYLMRGSLAEARETYRFLLKLTPHDDTVMVKLGDIAEQQGDLDEAIGYYEEAVVANDAQSARFYHLAELLVRVKQPHVAKEALVPALELEPRNPKYLDLLAEIAILCNDKALGEQALKELRLANPDNQKLESLRVRIMGLRG
jgi:Tfp pilus assembly protein PilF